MPAAQNSCFDSCGWRFLLLFSHPRVTLQFIVRVTSWLTSGVSPLLQGSVPDQLTSANPRTLFASRLLRAVTFRVRYPRTHLDSAATEKKQIRGDCLAASLLFLSGLNSPKTFVSPLILLSETNPYVDLIPATFKLRKTNYNFVWDSLSYPQ